MRDHLTEKPGLMDISEVVNRVIAAIMLATLSGLAGAVLAAQSNTTVASAPVYPEPDQVGALDIEQQGPTITGGTSDSSGRHRQGFLVVELADQPTELARGGSQLRWVNITNPHDVDIVVTRLTADVGLPIVPDHDHDGTCLPSDFSVEPLPGPVTVLANDSIELALIGRLDAAAPMACANAHFPLTYSGVATTP